MHIGTGSSLEDTFNRTCGKVIILCVNLLVGYVLFVEYFVVVPFEYYHKNFYYLTFLFFFGLYLFFNIFYHYYKSCFTSPGFAPKVDGPTICSECRYYKPSIAHHCRMCRRCVLRMDHHCVFIGQCVGLYNHRHFFQFVFFLWFGCLTAFLSCFNTIWYNLLIIPPFYHKEQAFCAVVSDSYFLKSYLCMDGMGGTVMVLILSSLSLCWSGVTIGFIITMWNGMLISADMTHVDSTKAGSWAAMFKSMKDYDNVKNNWINFLGLQTKRRSFIRHVLFPSGHVAVAYEHESDKRLLSVLVE